MTENLNQSNAVDQLFTSVDNHLEKESICKLVQLNILQENDLALYKSEEKITTEQFVIWLIRSVVYFKGKEESTHEIYTRDAMDYCIQKGIIEDYDMLNRQNPIERRQVARIVHDTLRLELCEKDEHDWSAAKKLTDIYSCRTCVQHIAQVYVKGIIEADQPNIFNPLGNITKAQATAIILKMVDRSYRNPKTNVSLINSIELTPEQADNLLVNNDGVLLIDVRSNEAYKNGHLAGSINYPLLIINQNPNIIIDDKNRPIILYCQKGYQSKLAADLLVNAGYTKVYTIPGVEQNGYDLVY
ncbi:MAG: rhodanese-like domain-containing protein [Amphibacillus sp.]|nr:rhodanese-like domain-containing protein [Amphibacillus sp.]